MSGIRSIIFETRNMEAKLHSHAADLVKKSVIDCDADETIDNAIRKMMQYKVSCLPVKHKEGNEIVYRGLMDWKHTIPYLVSQNQHLKSIDEFEITTYAAGGKVMVKELDLDVLCKGGHKITIKAAIAELGKSGAHQIYVEKSGLVSLTDILELLQDDIPKITLGDMVKEKHIYHITSAQPVKDALQLMHDHWVSSCAVLDRGELLGNISVGDLRKISCELHFHSLSMSASQFIKQGIFYH